MAAADKEHALVLKVMRLSRPPFQHGTPVPGHPTDAFWTDEERTPHEQAKNQAPESLMPVFCQYGGDDSLLLPRSFGNIYLGETFSSYICINNSSYADVKAVGAKVELQTASARFSLVDITASPLPRVASGESHDFVVHHEVKELGVHILVCSVQYVRGDGERKNFRKFFKFGVLNPLSVKTKTHSLQEDVWLEAQLQNNTQGPIHLSTVAFEPSSAYRVEDLNTCRSKPSGEGAKKKIDIHVPRASDNESVFGQLFYLKPGEVRQYLYRLTATSAESRFAPGIGKMSIVWSNVLGESGRLQTSQLQRKILRKELEVSVISVPPRIVVHEPFSAQCLITNLSDQPINCRLSFERERMGAIQISGVSGKLVAAIGPKASKVVQLDLFPIEAGVHSISGLLLMDIGSGKAHTFDKVCDLFIETGAAEEGKLVDL